MYLPLFQKIAADRNRTGPLTCMAGQCAKEKISVSFLPGFPQNLGAQSESVIQGKWHTCDFSWIHTLPGLPYPFQVRILKNKVTNGTVCYIFLVPFRPPLQAHSKRGLLCPFVMCRAKKPVLIDQLGSLLSHTLNCWCETHQSSPLFSQSLHSANSC